MLDAKHETSILLSMNISQVHTAWNNTDLQIQRSCIESPETHPSWYEHFKMPYPTYQWNQLNTTFRNFDKMRDLIEQNLTMTVMMTLIVSSDVMTESMFLSIHAFLNASV